MNRTAKIVYKKHGSRSLFRSTRENKRTFNKQKRKLFMFWCEKSRLNRLPFGKTRIYTQVRRHEKEWSEREKERERTGGKEEDGKLYESLEWSEAGKKATLRKHDGDFSDVRNASRTMKACSRWKKKTMNLNTFTSRLLWKKIKLATQSQEEPQWKKMRIDLILSRRERSLKFECNSKTCRTAVLLVILINKQWNTWVQLVRNMENSFEIKYWAKFACFFLEMVSILFFDPCEGQRL